jgi:hypothetical protein
MYGTSPEPSNYSIIRKITACKVKNTYSFHNLYNCHENGTLRRVVNRTLVGDVWKRMLCFRSTLPSPVTP